MKSHLLRPLGWILLAAAAALAIWLVAVPIAGIQLTVGIGAGQPINITPAPILIASTASGLVAWALLVVLSRFLARGYTVWMIMAAVVLILSVSGPITAEATTATRVVLVLMHAVVATTLVLGLPRTLPIHTTKGRADRTAPTRAATDVDHPAPR
ncbi:DUF6069 family protein [Arthrobacter sp. Br18]|uniref:DUF6069 family protein n=1 Tax=Arthrobacter sp. Br18 TaxID=1312954 RepID=UPI0004B41EE7|nr:DUF6069 family protein [Arthrobacter sp. Br18]